MPNNKTTSKNIGSIAAKLLQDPNASKIQKELAGSALSQIQKGNQTGSAMQEKAGKVLESDKYSDLTQTLAASILSQSPK
ncbi:hypothetical protein [Spirosoma arcticum]